ncbi:MAG: glycosyltransferase [Candidatus Omnitrophica bacterium]|nr:glycosyltransferase [Candidatus Omnitrophota bacterium]
MVSIIIPTFNRAQFLKKAIGSVLSQAYSAIELIVVDDGSQDDTPAVVSRYAGRLKYLRQENKGVSAARNLGIKNSSGGFIAFLDSDDWWDRDKLAVQLAKMRQSPDYIVSHTQETWYKNGRLLNQKEKHRKHHGYIFDKCLAMCCVSMSTAIVRRGLFDSVGLFDEDLPCCEDYDFWLRVSARHEFLLIDRPLTLKAGGRPDQVSSIYATGMDRFRIEAILKLLKSNELAPDQRTLATRELHKKCQIYGSGCLKHGRVDEGRRYLQLAAKF